MGTRVGMPIPSYPPRDGLGISASAVTLPRHLLELRLGRRCVQQRRTYPLPTLPLPTRWLNVRCPASCLSRLPRIKRQQIRVLKLNTLLNDFTLLRRTATPRPTLWTPATIAAAASLALRRQPSVELRLRHDKWL